MICIAALIAALYVVLTLIAAALGLDKYAIQVRFAEALCVLAFFTPAAIPGLWVGCMLANIITQCHIIDVIFGSLATLAGAVGAYVMGCIYRKHTIGLEKPGKWALLQWFCPWPTIIANTIAVPIIIYYCYTAAEEQTLSVIPLSALTVFAGECISAGVLGLLLFKEVDKTKLRKFIQVAN